MTEVINNIEVEEQKPFVLPEGVTIVKKTVTMSVRKIRNGYVLRKSYDIKWKMEDSDDTQYDFYVDEWYSKDNPVTVTMPKEKSLAEKLD